MKIAHTLFHYDSRHLLEELARQQKTSGPRLGRRELAILLPSVAMRAAGLDRYKQGYVWARITAERPGDEIRHPQRHRAAVHRLMTIDVSTTSRNHPGLARAAGRVDRHLRVVSASSSPTSTARATWNEDCGP
jgi:protein-L-isoaspartate(D-aspartate) O-methyltransferase